MADVVPPPHPSARISPALAVLAVVVVAMGTMMFSADSSGSAAQRSAEATSGPLKTPVFAYYYLWWSRIHWQDMLGPNYPYAVTPLPLPATLDANGCNPINRYPGNHLTDVPAKLYSQDDPGFIEADVRQAAAAGLTGFAINWVGTGKPDQRTTDIAYSRRLQAMVDAVHRVNAEGIPFKLWLSYRASAQVLPASWILGDLSYFIRQFGSDSAFDHTATRKPTVIWQGSRKYPVSVLGSVNAHYRGILRIIGDEKIWTTTRSAFLDGDAYYWSSQNPWSNPQSFQQLLALSRAVRASGPNPDGTAKVWVAPAAPGYDAQLAGGSSCVPRHGGQTLRALMAGNNATRPNAWAVISWNEITEGTYLDPMTRFGTQDLTVLTNIVHNGL